MKSFLYKLSTLFLYFAVMVLSWALYIVVKLIFQNPEIWQLYLGGSIILFMQAILFNRLKNK